MSGIVNNAIRLALSVSLLERDSFIKNVSEVLEAYKNDPEKMEKVASGLYQYLEDLKERMNTKSMITEIVDDAKLPTGKDMKELSKAIEKLSMVIEGKHKKQDHV
jgi:hypothetical protein